eukprot:458281-Lingulodinium_polyedra.AAC.1
MHNAQCSMSNARRAIYNEQCAMSNAQRAMHDEQLPQRFAARVLTFHTRGTKWCRAREVSETRVANRCGVAAR